MTNTLSLRSHWLLSPLLGSTIYAGFNGLVHFSDWCYLAASMAVAAVASAVVLPLYGWLLGHLMRHGQQWSALGRWAWLVGGTLALFGLANLLVGLLRTWPGPGGAWPWGMAAVVVSCLAVSQWHVFQRDAKKVSSHNENYPAEG